jgi:hypothetical protein
LQLGSSGRDQDCGSKPANENGLKIPNTKQGWWSSASGRTPAKQVQTPVHQKKRRQLQELFNIIIISLQSSNKYLVSA